MAGTVDQVIRVSTGIEAKGDVLWLNPELAPETKSLDLRIRYRGHSIDLHLTRNALTVRGEDLDVAPITLSVAGKTYEFFSGSTRVFQLDDAVPKHALLKTEDNAQLNASPRSP